MKIETSTRFTSWNNWRCQT